MPGAIVPYVKNDARVSGIVYTGVSCQACGWTKADDRAQHHDLKCSLCKRAIGPKRAVQDRPLPTIVCSDCSAKHLERNNPRPLQVRFDVRCPGCDKLLAHYDDWEEKILAKGSKIPTHFCTDPKCQLKFAVPVPSLPIDPGDAKKQILGVLSDAAEKKVSGVQAMDSIRKILTEPPK